MHPSREELIATLNVLNRYIAMGCTNASVVGAANFIRRQLRERQ